MLISCVVYRNGQKLADIPKEDISDYVSRRDCFVWVGLFEPTREELDEIADEFDLHSLAIEDARKGHQRPKVEEYEDSLFVVLHTVEPVSDADDADLLVGEVDIFVGRNYVLSVRHRTQRGFADVRARAEREPDLLKHGSGFVLYALMDSIVDRYFPVLERLETALELAEERMFDTSSSGTKIEALYVLKRQLMKLRHSVTPMMESVGKLYGGRVPTLALGLENYFRDVYDHLQRINAEIESIREMLSTGIQVNLALIALADNVVTKRLAAWGALITVPTFIVGIYGMNFEHMPELRWTFGYPLVLAVIAATDAVLWWRFRRVGWL